MVADRCEATAEKQTLCNDFCLEHCLLLTLLLLLLLLLLPPPARTMQRNVPKVVEQLFDFFVVFCVFFVVFEGLEPARAHLGQQRIADRKKETIKQKVPGQFEVILIRFLI